MEHRNCNGKQCAVGRQGNTGNDAHQPIDHDHKHHHKGQADGTGQKAGRKALLTEACADGLLLSGVELEGKAAGGDDVRQVTGSLLRILAADGDDGIIIQHLRNIGLGNLILVHINRKIALFHVRTIHNSFRCFGKLFSSLIGEKQLNVGTADARIVHRRIFILCALDVGADDPGLAVGILETDLSGGAELLDSLLGVIDRGDLHNQAAVAGDIYAGFRIALGIQALLNHGLCNVHVCRKIGIGHAVGNGSFIGDLGAAHQIQAENNAILHRLHKLADAEQSSKDQASDDEHHENKSNNAFLHGYSSS